MLRRNLNCPKRMHVELIRLELPYWDLCFKRMDNILFRMRGINEVSVAIKSATTAGTSVAEKKGLTHRKIERVNIDVLGSQASTTCLIQRVNET